MKKKRLNFENYIPTFILTKSYETQQHANDNPSSLKQLIHTFVVTFPTLEELSGWSTPTPPVSLEQKETFIYDSLS